MAQLQDAPMSPIAAISRLLDPSERRKAVLVFGVVLVMAGFEVLGVSGIFLFVRVLLDPALLSTEPIVRFLFSPVEGIDPGDQILAFGFLVLSFLILKSAISLLGVLVQARFVWNQSHALSLRLLRKYLSSPYEYFLGRSSSTLSKNLLSEVQSFSGNFLAPLVQSLSELAIAAAILGIIVFLDPALALGIFLVFGAIGTGVYFAVQRRLHSLGEANIRANENRFEAASRAFGGIKEIKFFDSEGEAIAQFGSPSKEYAHSEAQRQTVAQVPRLALEVFAFGGLLIVVAYGALLARTPAEVLGYASLYAIAGYRVLPSINRIVSNLASMRFYLPVARNLAHELGADPRPAKTISGAPFRFTNSLEASEVSYTYSTRTTPAIDAVTVRLQKGRSLGVLGPTGSGKSTLLDLLVGLISPSAGVVRVDGEELSGARARSFRMEVGYVPQHMFLLNDTVERNIAFGVSPGLVNRTLVQAAAQVAQADDFIQNELPQGYQTVIGERGVRLSGGQRQRLGIARALYRRPSVLVLDEATNALDAVTEASLFDALRRQTSSLTLIVVTHRASSIRFCDEILFIQGGKVVGRGSFGDLMIRSGAFREMAAAANDEAREGEQR